MRQSILGRCDEAQSALVTLGGTNHGTQTAVFCLQTSCQEMIPNSSFLIALNATDETWGTPRYATWWPPCEMVYAQVRDWVNQPAPAAAIIASAR